MRPHSSYAKGGMRHPDKIVTSARGRPVLRRQRLQHPQSPLMRSRALVVSRCGANNCEPRFCNVDVTRRTETNYCSIVAHAAVPAPRRDRPELQAGCEHLFAGSLCAESTNVSNVPARFECFHGLYAHTCWNIENHAAKNGCTCKCHKGRKRRIRLHPSWDARGNFYGPVLAPFLEVLWRLSREL